VKKYPLPYKKDKQTHLENSINKISNHLKSLEKTLVDYDIYIKMNEARRMLESRNTNRNESERRGESALSNITPDIELPSTISQSQLNQFAQNMQNMQNLNIASANNTFDLRTDQIAHQNAQSH
jgi:hypothetical protein